MRGIEKTRSDVATIETGLEVSVNQMQCHATMGTSSDDSSTFNAGLQGRLALKPKEAAPLIGVGVNRIYALCHRADFPAIQVGTGYIIPVDGLRRWLDQQTRTEV